MDEIICSECGRPNLIEAKKCWYCQTELNNPPSGPIVESESVIPADVEHDNLVEDDFKVDEEIPEWLKRIRQRIENDRNPEEEMPYWRQKDIFGGEKKAKLKTKKDKKASPPGKTKKKASGKAQNKRKKSTPPEKSKPLPGKEVEKTDSDVDIDTLSEDLPDGFTKL